MTGTATVLACVLAIVGGGSGPAAQPTGPELPGGSVRVSMSHVDGQVVVPVRIDGHGPFLFRIDTGSSVPVSIDDALADRLGLQPAAPGRGLASGSTAAGGFAIERLELGGATFRDLAAARLPAQESDAPAAALASSKASLVEGTLGFPLFHDVLLTIDYAGGTVELQRGALSSESEGVVPLVGSLDTPQVPIQVGDRVYLARLDTGFADNVAFPLGAASELRTEAAPAAVGRVQVDGRLLDARSARLAESLLVAGRRYDRLPVIFAALGSGPRIGYGLLAYFSLTFDQTSGLVQIMPQPAAG